MCQVSHCMYEKFAVYVCLGIAGVLKVSKAMKIGGITEENIEDEGKTEIPEHKHKGD